MFVSKQKIHYKPNTKHAFSLVELSVVLAVTGLLIGSVISARTIMYASDLRSVSAQRQAFQIAFVHFREKYGSLPGDMPDAVSVWGIAAGLTGNNALCGATESVDKKTCNGDGNNRIMAPTAGGGPETTRAWQHLANAGLIEGFYTGAYDNGIGDKNNTNCPTSRIPKSVWTAYYFPSRSGSPDWFDGDYGHVLWLSGFSKYTDPSVPVFTNEDIYRFDVKEDDGMPATGQIFVFSDTGITNCATDSSPVTSTSFGATYKITETAKLCIMGYRQQF